MSKSKRALAALGVVLAFAAVLVVVPLATADEADAHSRTKTVQRCSYDPFAGEQCWTETVNVSHVHRCGAGLTGTYPNCYPIPPVTQPVCPAGMTGTPPNCYPPPPATTEPPPPPTTAAPPPTTAAPPPTTAYVPPTTTTTTTPPPPCVPPRHRHGSTCHPDHGEPPCGTGLWTPHAGHTPQQRPACEDDKDDNEGGEKGTRSNRCADNSEHRHLMAGHMTGCHDAAPADHCPAGQHAHSHAGACHRNDVRSCEPGEANNSLGCLTMHCSDGHHEHTHGSGDCHPSRTVHCEAGQHTHAVTSFSDWRTSAGCHPIGRVHCEAGQHQHGDTGCHSMSHGECAEGEHEHPNAKNKNPNVAYYTCHPKSDVHYEVSTLDRLLLPPIFCGIPTSKISDALLRVVARGSCKELFDSMEETDRKRYEQLNKEHSDDAANDDGDDADDAANDDGDDADDSDSDPALEGSWDDVWRRHGTPQDSEDRQALYKRYICSRVYVEGWCE